MAEISRAHLWLMVGLAALATGFGMVAAGLGLELSHSGWRIATLTGLIALAFYYPRLKPGRERQLGDILECCGLLSLIGMIGALASYAIVARTTGYADGHLAAFGRAIGFDWRAYYHFVAARPAVALVAKQFYLSIFVTPALVVAGLVLAGRIDRARGLAAAMMTSLAITLAIFPFFPARSALAYFIDGTPAYVPATGLTHIAVIEQLRSGALTRIDPDALAGLITFPSFHAAAAAMFVWAAWPVRAMRWPIAAINAGMIVVTPIEGTHYLIDVIGGVAVAGVAVGLLYLPIPVFRRRRATKGVAFSPA